MYAGMLCPDITTRKGVLSAHFRRIRAVLDSRGELWPRLVSTGCCAALNLTFWYLRLIPGSTDRPRTQLVLPELKDVVDWWVPPTSDGPRSSLKSTISL